MNKWTTKLLLDKDPRVCRPYALGHDRPRHCPEGKAGHPSITSSGFERLRRAAGGRSNMIPQPTSCGTLAHPFMGGSSPLGSRSRREPETSSTAKTPRRKQNRNTASSKSLFLSASKINTSQPDQSIGPSLRSAPPAEGATTCQPGLLAPRFSLYCTFPSTAAKPNLVQLL